MLVLFVVTKNICSQHFPVYRYVLNKPQINQQIANIVIHNFECTTSVSYLLEIYIYIYNCKFDYLQLFPMQWLDLLLFILCFIKSPRFRFYIFSSLFLLSLVQ